MSLPHRLIHLLTGKGSSRPMPVPPKYASGIAGAGTVLFALPGALVLVGGAPQKAGFVFTAGEMLVPAVIGFLLLSLLYQLPEANGQDLLKIPGKPYSTFGLFILTLAAVALVACWQGDTGLSSYGMGLHPGWWQNYLLGVGLGGVTQAVLEMGGVRLGVRRVSEIKFSLTGLLIGVLWILFANFPAAAVEDLITRGYIFRWMQASPLLVFMLVSAALYTLNHIIRLLTRPATDWYHLPLTGLTLAYALAQTGSLWYVIGLHQSGNVIYYLMRKMMKVSNTTDTRKRIGYGVVSELVFLLVVILATRLAVATPFIP